MDRGIKIKLCIQGHDLKNFQGRNLTYSAPLLIPKVQILTNMAPSKNNTITWFPNSIRSIAKKHCENCEVFYQIYISLPPALSF